MSYKKKSKFSYRPTQPTSKLFKPFKKLSKKKVLDNWMQKWTHTHSTPRQGPYINFFVNQMVGKRKFRLFSFIIQLPAALRLRKREGGQWKKKKGKRRKREREKTQRLQETKFRQDLITGFKTKMTSKATSFQYNYVVCKSSNRGTTLLSLKLTKKYTLANTWSKTKNPILIFFLELCSL